VYIRQSKISNGIPVTGRGGLQGCEISRLPHVIDSLFTDGGELVGLMGRPLFTTYHQEDFWYSFVLEA
jgi:hypothetical protein